MAWKVTIDDKSIMLDDLSQDDFVKACKNHEDINWLRLYVTPGSHPDALYDLLVLIATRLEKPAPARPKNIREAVELLGYLEQVDDDLPTQFAEGGIPLEGPAETETITSSTSTEPADGPQPQLEPLP